MKPYATASLVLALSILSVLLLLYGTAIGMGDPAPWVPEAEIAARLKRSTAAWVTGACLWLAALILAGFGFRCARKLASAAWAVAAIPLLALAAFGLF